MAHFPRGRYPGLAQALAGAAQPADPATRRRLVLAAVAACARRPAGATAAAGDREASCPYCGTEAEVAAGTLEALAEAGLGIECGVCWQVSRPEAWLGEREGAGATEEPPAESAADGRKENRWKTISSRFRRGVRG